MKRWLAWFSIPPLLFVVGILFVWLTGADVAGVAFLFQLALGGWLAITIVAVPLAVIIWLVRGRPRAPIPTP